MGAAANVTLSELPHPSPSPEGEGLALNCFRSPYTAFAGSAKSSIPAVTQPNS